MLAHETWQSVFEMPQIAIAMGCLIPIVASIAFFWFKAQKVRSDNILKRTLVERGLSANEIERIMNAGQTETNPLENC